MWRATVCLGLILAGSPVLAAQRVAADNLVARYAKLGDELLVHGLIRGEQDESLDLRAFEVYTDDAKLVVMTATGEQVLPRPAVRYFRGHLASDPDSRVFLEVHAAGTVAGRVSDARGEWLIGSVDGALAITGVDSEAPVGEGFACALKDDHAMSPPIARPRSVAVAAPSGVLYSARVAIETDNEYLTRFSGNTTNATNYVGTLIGHLSTTYVNQLDTQLQVSFLRIWSVTDPYSQTDTACGLLEFGKYWNDNMGAQVRSTAHFLSGKAALSGIAWLGVLSEGAFNTGPAQVGATCPGLAATSNFGGAYGFTSGIDGNFNPGNPTIVWDTMSVAHEIGHNFDSPHTHCYGNIGGNASPVDQCYNGEAGNPGCYSGTQSLPGGAGSGTIMSYCHLLSGGLSNISFTFGRGHAFGVQPVRVPDRMLAHVQSQASAFPSCLSAPVVNLIYGNGFE